MMLDSNTALPRPRFKSNGREYVRYGPNDWRYADNEDIQVPGGRDMRLSERIEPMIASKGGKAQAVIIDGEDVERDGKTLGWTLNVGLPVRDEKGSLLHVIVPHQAWQAHDRIEQIMVAPELDEDEDVRRLAAAQLELRKTEHLLARQSEDRDQLLVELAEAGMTRQRAAEITGLSVGKVQQIIKKEELAANEVQLVRIVLATEPLNIAQIAERAKETKGLTKTRSKLKKYVSDLQSRGFLQSSDTGEWSVTPKALDELERASKKTKGRGSGSPPPSGKADDERQTGTDDESAPRPLAEAEPANSSQGPDSGADTRAEQGSVTPSTDIPT
jgi:hypothetical protein